jgi:hypothetical protein
MTFGTSSFLCVSLRYVILPLDCNKHFAGGRSFSFRHPAPNLDHSYRCVANFVSLASCGLTSGAEVYTYLITNFGDLVALNNLVWSVRTHSPYKQTDLFQMLSGASWLWFWSMYVDMHFEIQQDMHSNFCERDLRRPWFKGVWLRFMP